MGQYRARGWEAVASGSLATGARVQKRAPGSKRCRAVKRNAPYRQVESVQICLNWQPEKVDRLEKKSAE